MLGWSVGIYPDLNVFAFHSRNDSCKGGFNTPGYNNPEFDAVADAFEAAKTVEEAIALSNQLEAILYEDLPYLVLFNPPVLEVFRGDSVDFPFTDVLGGLVDACASCASVVTKQ